MLHLTTWRTRLRQTLPARIVLPILAGTLLIAPVGGALLFFAMRSPLLGALAQRVSAFQPARQPGCQGQACLNQDPIKEGCVADAVTQARVPIVYGSPSGTRPMTSTTEETVPLFSNGSGGVLQMTSTLTVHPGEIIGRIDRRYSPSCQAYWVRAFVFGSADASELLLTCAPDSPLVTDTENAAVPLALYSDMTPDPQSASTTVELIDDTGREFQVLTALG
jgi:hypothetical protein